jgi:hypothetical protein
MMQPFDAITIARDLVSQDEASRLFEVVHLESNRATGEPPDASQEPGWQDGYLVGLQFVMDVLDVRIGSLRERWG